MDSQFRQSDSPRMAFRPVLMFAAAVLITLLTGNLLFDNLREGIKREVQRNITSVGVLKANQIRDWLDDRLADARALSGNSFFSREATRWMRGGARSGELGGIAGARRREVRPATTPAATHGKSLISLGQSAWRR